MSKFFLVALCLAPCTVEASESCMLADEMDAALVDWHGETVISESSDGRFAFWHNADSGTWTVVEYLRSGQACVLGEGDQWPPLESSGKLSARFEV